MNSHQIPVNKENSVRADLVDYRDTGNLGHPFLEIDTYSTLEKAVSDFTSTGWEEDADELMQNCYFMADDETGHILAVGAYFKTDKSEMPALMWIFTQTGDTSIHYYEIEYSEFIKQCRDQLSVNNEQPVPEHCTLITDNCSLQKGGADD